MNKIKTITKDEVIALAYEIERKSGGYYEFDIRSGDLYKSNMIEDDPSNAIMFNVNDGRFWFDNIFYSIGE